MNSEQSFQISFKIIKCPFEIISKSMKVVTMNSSEEYKTKKVCVSAWRVKVTKMSKNWVDFFFPH